MPTSRWISHLRKQSNNTTFDNTCLTLSYLFAGSKRHHFLGVKSPFWMICSMVISGSNRWRYVSTICLAIFCGDIPWNDHWFVLVVFLIRDRTSNPQPRFQFQLFRAQSSHLFAGAKRHTQRLCQQKVCFFRGVIRKLTRCGGEIVLSTFYISTHTHVYLHRL